MRQKLFFLVITIFLLLSTNVFADGSNLIGNGSFEENTGGNPNFWSTWAWETKSDFSLDSTQFHSGKSSAVIVNREDNYALYKQTITVQPSSYYRISGWVKTENVGSVNKGANISVENLILSTPVDVKETSNDWKQIEFYGLTGKDQQSLTLTLGVGGYGSINKGKAWFDDIEVQKVDGVPAGKTAENLFATNTASSSSSSGGVNVVFIILGILLFLALAVLGFIIYKYKTQRPEKNITDDKTSAPVAFKKPSIIKLKLDKKDIIIMASMTLIYLVIALVNLGDMKAPETFWTPATTGENFTIDLGKETEVSRLAFYCGLGKTGDIGGKYIIQYQDQTGKFVSLVTFEKRDVYDVFLWKNQDIAATRTSKLKILVDKPGGALNEIGIFQNGSQTPLKDFKVTDISASAQDQGKVENLFDEQDKVQYKPSYMSGTYFDEIYHARTAYEHLHKIQPFETTHPPLGKVLISFGIAIFGMVPFGWRIIGTLFGAAMIPIMYAFGKKMFDGRFYGFCAAFLMMFDFMHFVQTRISTIDSYGTFFAIIMYYYMYDYFVNKSYNQDFVKSLKPLFLSGLFFGIGVASKWIVLYGAGGLAMLFFLAKALEYRDYLNIKDKVKKVKGKNWVKDFIPLNLGGTAAACVVFFIIIPIIIYTLSYIPFMSVPGPGHGLKEVWESQKNMFDYHSKLVAEHPFTSRPETWPVMWKPMGYYVGTELPAGLASTINALGNPAIWWIAIAAVPIALALAVFRRDKHMTVIFVAIAFQYIPWFFVDRLLFIYHFFSVVPFMILAIVYIIKCGIDFTPYTKYATYVYLAIVAILFVTFYPVLSGMEVSREYIDQNLRWFKQSWFF